MAKQEEEIMCPIGERLPIIAVEKEDYIDCEGCVFTVKTPMGQGCTNERFACTWFKRKDKKNVKFVIEEEVGDYEYEEENTGGSQEDCLCQEGERD